MTELAFKVDKNSKFYSDYFVQHQEQLKFNDLAKEFFKSRGLITEGGGYYPSETLSFEISEENLEKYKKQLRKYVNKDGLYTAKKNSKLQKEWNTEVTSKIDFKKLDSMKFWWLSVMNVSSYALWHHEDEIYGKLILKSEDFTLPSHFIIIKLSEYYKVIEDSEERKNENK